MNVAGHDLPDLPMRGDHPREFVRTCEPESIHKRQAGAKRRMMHEHHGRLSGRLRESCREPGDALFALCAACLPRHMGIEANEPHRPVIHHVVQEACARQVSVVRERTPHGFAIVMVAGNHVERRFQRHQDLAQPVVLGGGAFIDRVASE